MFGNEYNMFIELFEIYFTKLRPTEEETYYGETIQKPHLHLIKLFGQSEFIEKINTEICSSEKKVKHKSFRFFQLVNTLILSESLPILNSLLESPKNPIKSCIDLFFNSIWNNMIHNDLYLCIICNFCFSHILHFFHLTTKNMQPFSPKIMKIMLLTN